ncbi:MAG: hypothetical protein NTZ10_02145 [Candidatus Saganbacteria bacterium]|nr:hypothetical protein [Candidatus Saganbacteria bacterium]
MIIKVIVEIILGFILLGVSSAFWNCVKSPKFLANVLGDYDELKRFFHHLGKENIKHESEVVDPKIGFSANIVLWIKASLSALDKTRNMLLVVIIGIFIGSYFLGNIFLLINAVLFFIMAFPSISAAAKNNIITDIHTIMLNVYKWNKVNHAECERFCNLEQPRIMKNIYRVVTEE